MMSSKLRQRMSGLLMACVLLAGGPAMQRPAMAEPLTVGAAVVGLGMFLFQWLAGHALDNATGIRGTVDTRQLRADLRKLAQSHQEHAAVIEQLQAQLNDTMSRTEVEQLLREALARVDERLSKLEQEVSRHNSELESHARRLGLHDDEVAQLKQQQAAHYQELGQRIAQQSTRLDGHDREIHSMQSTLGRHQAELSLHAGELSTLNRRSMQHSARLDQHEAGIKDLDDEFAEMRRDYPRINPQRQGALLAASGAKALERGDLADAARCFHLGKATNPNDPAMEYGLALILHRQNRDQEAEAAIARGIVLEREHGAQKRSWFVSDRFQGPDRIWLESSRRDPVYGVLTPGDLGTVARE